MFSRLPVWLMPVILASVFIAGLLINPRSASADFIRDRSVTLSTAQPSAISVNNFKFTIPSTTNVGSIAFEYCSNSPLAFYPCTAPPGLDTNSAVLASQSGNVSFSIDNADTTANKIVITRPNAPVALIPNTYIFNSITNPSTPGQSVFVRLSTHASTDGSGPAIDSSAVAFSITGPFEIGAYVPPFLKLCVGITVAPDCSSQIGDSLDLGIFTSSAARSGQSQFSTATNDPSGYVIYALGTTMTSGNNIISSVPNLAPSFPGTGQFGINLRSNLIPAVGQDPVGVGTGTPAAIYNVPNRYSFNTGDNIASSNLPSDYNRMTVSYLVNIPSKQPPGVYSTTVTYVATVQF